MKPWLPGVALGLLGSGPGAAAAERDLLLIALDAVPYASALEAHRGSDALPELFTAFRPPVPLISTFPSTTSVAFGEILAAHGLERSPGYEARFFDWERRAKAGGGPISYFRVRFPWREFFDWNRKGPFASFLAATRPVRSSVREIETAVRRFVDSPASVYLIYIAPTDTAMHVLGPQSAQPVLAALDTALVAARTRRAGRPFDTVIFSDHGITGGEPLVNVARKVRRALRQAGLTPVSRLRRSGQVVMTPYGLVSSFELYTAPEDEAAAAEAAARVPGVDLCARTDGRGWQVVDAEGSMEFERVDGGGERRWRFSSHGKNPLGLTLGELHGGQVRDRGFTDPALGTRYPDPLHRIARAFELVENPASVACSLDPGFMYGPRHTELLARLGKGRLRWTHGALGGDATLGFVMSDAPGWSPPGALRAADALAPFAARVRLARQRSAAVAAAPPGMPMSRLLTLPSPSPPARPSTGRRAAAAASPP